jgi:alpha-mannosidase
VKDAMLLYGAGDHGGGPRMEDVVEKRAMTKWRGAPRVAYATPSEYFLKNVAPYQTSLPVYQGSLGGLTNISYLSQARNKQLNRQCENLLLTVEKLATLGTFYQRKPSYPRADFVNVWKPVLFNQFHDIIAGTSNGRVYDDAEADLQRALDESNRLLEEGIEHIAARIDTRGQGIPLIVFNPLSWNRTDAVETSVTFLEPTETFSVKDEHGNAVPVQKVGVDADHRRWRIVFLADRVPSIGYKMFRVFPGETLSPFEGGKGDVPVAALKASTTELENEHLHVTLSPTGTLLSLFDKAAGRETLREEANVFTMTEDTNPSSSWVSVLGNTQRGLENVGQPELLEEGPVRAVVRRTFRSADSIFKVDTILCAGAARVEFEFNADWHDKDATLLANFPTCVDGGMGAIDMPYGSEEVKPDGTRRCAQQWVDLSNADYGVSLLNNGRYEFYLDKNIVRMGVLRGARDMDPRMDEGDHQFRYAVYPHSRSWRDAETVRQAYALNNPLIAVQESHHGGQTDSWATQRCDFSLPAEQSFITVSSENVVVPVVKIPQDRWTTTGELILRLVETAGRATKCELALPFGILKAVETDHLEETVLGDMQADRNKVTVNLEPGEIKTLKLRIAGGGSIAEGN